MELPAACAARGPHRVPHARLRVRRAREDGAGQGLRGLRRRQRRGVGGRLPRRPQLPSSTSTSPAAPGAGGRSRTGSRATRACSPTWRRSRSRSRRSRTRWRSSPTSWSPTHCGAGRYRGGAPFYRDYRMSEEEAVVQVRSDRQTHRPYGLYGGRPGAPGARRPQPDEARCEDPAVEGHHDLPPWRRRALGAAGRRRLGRPAGARSAARAPRRAQRAGEPGRGGARLRRRSSTPSVWRVDEAATGKAPRGSAAAERAGPFGVPCVVRGDGG